MIPGFWVATRGPTKLYPRTVSTPIDEASISLIFRKIPVMAFDALLLGWNEGRVLPSSGIFETSWAKPAPYAYQPKNTAAKTPLRAECILRAAADEVENRPRVTSVVLYFIRVRISPYKPP